MPLRKFKIEDASDRLEDFLTGYTELVKFVRTSLWPSESGHCARRTTLSLTTEFDFTRYVESNFHFKMGDAIETVVTDALHSKGVLLWKNYQLPRIKIGNWDMAGRIDGIVYVNRKIRVLEIKSCGKLPAKPKHEHMAQAGLYTNITGIPSTILYVSRNPHNNSWVSFDVPESDEPITNAVMGAYAAKNRLMPHKLPYKSHCEFCPFISHCWDDISVSDVHNELETEDYETASKLVSDFMSKQNQRRNGIFKHMFENGNDLCKSVLSGEWENLI